MTKNHLELNVLNLSKNPLIDDNVSNMLSLLFIAKSSIRELILDETSISYDGVLAILKSLAQNIKVKRISFTDCDRIKFDTKEK